MDSKRLYLDYNATSPLSDSVIDWLKSGEVLFANPSSQHSGGKASRKIINETRSKLFRTFKLNEKEQNLFFHSGATEGISTFAHSFCEWARSQNRELLICYSKLDHPAVLNLPESSWGAHVSFLELTIGQDLAYEHAVNLGKLKELKKQKPDLLILYHHLWVHNETGIVSGLEALAPFKELTDLYLHVDAVQVPGKIPDWTSLSVGDIFTFSAHKFGALKGVGFSFFSKKISFFSLIAGGGQQANLRSGTENVMGVQSISFALEDLSKVDISKIVKLREKLEAFIKRELGTDGGIVSERSPHRNSNTIYFYLNELSSDIALALFDQLGLMISAGSACSSGAAKPSVILTHLGFREKAKNGLRISLGFKVDESQIELIQSRFTQVLERLRKSD